MRTSDWTGGTGEAVLPIPVADAGPPIWVNVARVNVAESSLQKTIINH